jgi:hypothetical protein
MSGPLFGKKFKDKLLFVPNADTHPKVQHEITEFALLRCLINEEIFDNIEDPAEIPAMLNTLNCIDKLSRITEIEIHESSMGSLKDLGKAFHVFIVFKTTSGKVGDYWWSLEKNPKYIVMQRSLHKNDVKDRLYGKKRKKVKSINENLAGKGTIKDLFAILWAYEAISEKYHIVKSNCQSLVTLVSKTITEIGYEFKGYFEYEYSPQENERNAKMLDFINTLSNSFNVNTHPLHTVVFYENTELFDQVMENVHYNIDDPIDPDGSTPLHLAIVFETPKMVRHLLEKWKADPTKRDGMGMNALQKATCWASNNMEIIDLLLEHCKS